MMPTEKNDECRISTDQRDFVMVYHDFLDSKLLTGKEKLVYIMLKRYLSFRENEGTVFPKVETIAEKCEMSRPTVTKILQSLQKKGVLRKTQRGLNRSNLYTLYDYESIWKSETKEDVTKAIEDEEIQKAIKLLKEKGLLSDTDQSTDKSLELKSNLSCNNITPTNINCQSFERYKIDDLKLLFNYNALINDQPEYAEYWDYIMEILYDTYNSNKSIIRVNKEDKPLMVVLGRFNKLSNIHISYVIDNYLKQKNKITNVKSYLLTAMYNSIDIDLAYANRINTDE